ncbi:unnamed protein product [Owenia fusiformis]|uniref:Uncharacterized protein n=1 Tax=Owenia fusiformis TaxID=6347 RepID=A0A8J1U3N7_OWEFU|nr:unnamed protein product [Owenia fusiformis]
MATMAKRKVYEIAGGLYPGKSIEIGGLFISCNGNFAVALQCDQIGSRHIGIALKILVDYPSKEFTLSWNRNGTESEFKVQPSSFPFNIKEDFSFVLEATKEKYQVRIDGLSFRELEFEHKIPLDTVTHIALENFQSVFRSLEFQDITISHEYENTFTQYADNPEVTRVTPVERVKGANTTQEESVTTVTEITVEESVTTNNEQEDNEVIVEETKQTESVTEALVDDIEEQIEVATTSGVENTHKTTQGNLTDIKTEIITEVLERKPDETIQPQDDEDITTTTEEDKLSFREAVEAVLLNSSVDKAKERIAEFEANNQPIQEVDTVEVKNKPTTTIVYDYDTTNTSSDEKPHEELPCITTIVYDYDTSVSSTHTHEKYDTISAIKNSTSETNRKKTPIVYDLDTNVSTTHRFEVNERENKAEDKTIKTIIVYDLDSKLKAEQSIYNTTTTTTTESYHTIKRNDNRISVAYDDDSNLVSEQTGAPIRIVESRTDNRYYQRGVGFITAENGHIEEQANSVEQTEKDLTFLEKVQIKVIEPIKEFVRGDDKETSESEKIEEREEKITKISDTATSEKSIDSETFPYKLPSDKINKSINTEIVTDKESENDPSFIEKVQQKFSDAFRNKSEEGDETNDNGNTENILGKEDNTSEVNSSKEDVLAETDGISDKEKTTANEANELGFIDKVQQKFNETFRKKSEGDNEKNEHIDLDSDADQQEVIVTNDSQTQSEQNNNAKLKSTIKSNEKDPSFLDKVKEKLSFSKDSDIDDQEKVETNTNKPEEEKEPEYDKTDNECKTKPEYENDTRFIDKVKDTLSFTRNSEKNARDPGKDDNIEEKVKTVQSNNNDTHATDSESSVNDPTILDKIKEKLRFTGDSEKYIDEADKVEAKQTEIVHAIQGDSVEHRDTSDNNPHAVDSGSTRNDQNLLDKIKERLSFTKDSEKDIDNQTEIDAKTNKLDEVKVETFGTIDSDKSGIDVNLLLPTQVY